MKSIIKLGSLLLAAGLLLSGCKKPATGGSPLKGLTERVTGEKEDDQARAGWVSFDKANHKFSLKHPKEWLYVPEIDKETLLTGSLEREDPSQEDFVDEITGEPFTVVYTINMRVEDNQDNLSARDYELKGYIPQGRETINQKMEDVTIAGVPGVKINSEVTQVNTSGPVSEYLLAPGNGKAYRFWYVASAHPETHEKFLPEFKEILETLEFSE